MSNNNGEVGGLTKTAARAYMRNTLRFHRDKLTGEVNMTELAEHCATVFGADHLGGPLDQPEHWLWDLAYQVSCE